MSTLEKVTRNLGLKVLSLLCAILLWLFATSGMEGQTSITVPVRYQNLSPGLEISDNAPATIDFRIAGPKLLLWRAKKDAVVVTLDLQGVGEGTVTYNHLEKYMHFRSGVSVTRVYPATIELHVRKSDERSP